MERFVFEYRPATQNVIRSILFYADDLKSAEDMVDKIFPKTDQLYLYDRKVVSVKDYDPRATSDLDKSLELEDIQNYFDDLENPNDFEDLDEEGYNWPKMKVC